MDFSAQPLSTTAHYNVGKVTIPNVTVDGSFTDAQCLSRFLYGEQPLVIIRGDRQSFSPKMKSRPGRAALGSL
jgi:hypothetical protein